MHQANKLKLAHHINKLSNYSGSSPIDGISSITVIAAVWEFIVTLQNVITN
jgi:hypothetical protein